MPYLSDCDSSSVQAIAVTFWSLSILKYDAPALFESLAARALVLLPHSRPSGQVILQIQSFSLFPFLYVTLTASAWKHNNPPQDPLFQKMEDYELP